MFATDCIWCLPGGMCGCGVDTKGHLGLRQSEGMCINALRQDDVCKQGSTIVKIVCSFTCLTICSAFQTSVIIFPGWRSPWLSFNTIRRRVDFWQVEPGGVGGEVEEELLFFYKTFYFKHLCFMKESSFDWKVKVNPDSLLSQVVHVFSYISSFCTFYHQYLIRSRLAWKCSSEIYQIQKDSLWLQ